MAANEHDLIQSILQAIEEIQDNPVLNGFIPQLRSLDSQVWMLVDDVRALTK